MLELLLKHTVFSLFVGISIWLTFTLRFFVKKVIHVSFSYLHVRDVKQSVMLLFYADKVAES